MSGFGFGSTQTSVKASGDIAPGEGLSQTDNRKMQPVIRQSSSGGELGIGDKRGSFFDRAAQREFQTRRTGRDEALAKGGLMFSLTSNTGIWVIVALLVLLLVFRK